MILIIHTLPKLPSLLSLQISCVTTLAKQLRSSAATFFSLNSFPLVASQQLLLDASTNISVSSIRISHPNPTWYCNASILVSIIFMLHYKTPQFSEYRIVGNI